MRTVCATAWLSVLLAWLLLSTPASGEDYAPPSSDPQGLHVFGQFVYFTAEDGLHGRELWRCNIGGAAELVADITPGSEGSKISKLSNFNSLLLFRVDPSSGGSELWRTDGTREGTKRLTQFSAESKSGFDGVCDIAEDGRAFIRVLADIACFWVTDGTTEGTRPWTMTMRDGTAVLMNYHGIFHTDRFFYFGATHPVTGPGFYRSLMAEGTAELVAPLESVAEILLPLDERRILFTAAQAGHGTELFVTEGPPATTRMLLDIAPGPASSSPSQLALVPGMQGQNLAVFTANDGTHGKEPWISDGTTEGTRMLADVYPGAEGAQPYSFISFGDRITFVAKGQDIGKELWFSPRPFLTASLLGDVYPGPTGSEPYSVCALAENKSVFSALHPALGEEIFFANASANLAQLQLDIYPGEKSSNPYGAVNLNSQVIFAATDPVHGRELWRIDAAGNVALLADIHTDGSVNPSSSPAELTPLGGLLYFVANDIVHGEELWATGGSGSNTVLLKDILPGVAGSAPRELTPAGNTLYFTAEDSPGHFGLWRSTGTPEETMPVEMAATRPLNLTALDSTLFFSAEREADGRELWVARQGAAELVCDIAKGSRSSHPRSMAVFQGAVYFLANDGTHGEELWRSDGTEAGTVMLRDIAPVPYEEIRYEVMAPGEKTLFFAAGSNSHGLELWHYPDGAERPAMVKDLAASIGRSR